MEPSHEYVKALKGKLKELYDANQQLEDYITQIKNSVKDACVITAIAQEQYVSQANLLKAAEKTRIEYEKVMKAEDHTVAKPQLSEETKNILKDAMQKKIDATNEIKADDIK